MYCSTVCSVPGSVFPDYLSDLIESVQREALHIILPNLRLSYDQAVVRSGLQTLLERRGQAYQRFVQALQASSSSCMLVCYLNDQALAMDTVSALVELDYVCLCSCAILYQYPCSFTDPSCNSVSKMLPKRKETLFIIIKMHSDCYFLSEECHLFNCSLHDHVHAGNFSIQL